MEAYSATEKFGIVVLLDALGIKNNSIEEAQRFIDFLNEYTSELHDYLDGLVNGDKEVKEHLAEESIVSRTFGDTVLLAWALPSSQDPQTIVKYMSGMGPVVSFLISVGLEKGFLLRGAMSVGAYLEDNSTLLGPAVTDAAEWHEQAEWFGCIATPNCSYNITAAKDADSVFEGLQATYEFKEYEVPIRGGKKTKLWAFNWPETYRAFCVEDPDEGSEQEKLLAIKEGAMQSFYSDLSKLRIPLGTEHKYVNTENFFKTCVEEFTC